MSDGVYKCNLCGEQIPADAIGAELMKAHLADKHGIPPVKWLGAKL